MCGALIVQALRNFQTVYRVGPIEMLSHCARFVALDGANAVPHQTWGMTRKRCDFVYPLLNVVLTKITLTTRRHCLHIGGRKSFGHRQQTHAVRRAPAGLTRSCNACLHGVEVVRQRSHG